MTFQPINGHVQVEPLKHDEFISSSRQSYEEIGTVISVAKDIYSLSNVTADGLTIKCTINVGDKVYFDSWLAAKYPNGKDGFYWLVKYEDIRAIDHEDTTRTQ